MPHGFDDATWAAMSMEDRMQVCNAVPLSSNLKKTEYVVFLTDNSGNKFFLTTCTQGDGADAERRNLERQYKLAKTGMIKGIDPHSVRIGEIIGGEEIKPISDADLLRELES